MDDETSMQKHIQALTQMVDDLAVIGETVTHEEKVMRLLSSLSKSYNVVVTALKASCDTVPGWGKVMLQEEKQLKETAEEGSHALRTKGGSRRGTRKGEAIKSSPASCRLRFCPHLPIQREVAGGFWSHYTHVP